MTSSRVVPADEPTSTPYLYPDTVLPSTDVKEERLSSDDGKKSDDGSIYDVSAAPPLAASPEEPPTLGQAILHLFRIKPRKAALDLDAVATQESVFDGPLALHYLPHPKWENNAAFDPAFRWSYRDEQAITRKVDWKIFLWIYIMFFALDIADNLLKDLKLSQGQYNLGNTLSKVGFLVAELPSQMLGKKIGVDIWLPFQLCIFSVLALAQFWMNGPSSFLALRFLIAFFQGGFIPDVILYLSYYYTKSQLAVRIAIFYTCNYITSLVTAFLAVGLLEMRGIGGKAGWRWMFLLEGIFTLLIGLASFWILAPGPSQTQGRLRPHLSEHEVKVIVNRVVRDDPGKATMHNRQALTFGLLWKSICDYDLWPMYLMGLVFGIPGTPLSNYFQISMKQLGFSTVMANLLSTPYIALSVINVILIVLLAEWTGKYTIVASLQNWWYLPFFIALVTLPNISPWLYFGLATGVLSYPYVHAIQVNWCSRNAGSVRTRTVSASLYNVVVQASSIIGANIYQASDSPRYYKGNKILLGIVAFNLAII
ncbi:hypothetical protein JCM10449v2_007523 [Rhodotorula kratochvilovae]